MKKRIINKKEIKTGDRFFRIKILSETKPSITPGGTIRRRFLCQCDCGKKWSVAMADLRSGDTKSCGCLKIDRSKKRLTKHGLCKNKSYRTWCGIKDRCLNSNTPSFKNYGGRGITVCDRWVNSFENFYEDMGEPSKELSIERVDNNKGYFKTNCKWATRSEQSRNKRNVRLITYKNKTQTILEWANEMGIKHGTMYVRFKKGWSVDKSLNFRQNI